MGISWQFMSIAISICAFSIRLPKSSTTARSAATATTARSTTFPGNSATTPSTRICDAGKKCNSCQGYDIKKTATSILHCLLPYGFDERVHRLLIVARCDGGLCIRHCGTGRNLMCSFDPTLVMPGLPSFPATEWYT
jgi:hypothetical protein